MIENKDLDNKSSLLSNMVKNTPLSDISLSHVSEEGSILEQALNMKIGERRVKKSSTFMAMIIALSFMGSGLYAFNSINKFTNTANHEQIEFENKPFKIDSQIHLSSNNNNNNLIEKDRTITVVENNLFKNKVLISSNDSSMIYPLTIENKSSKPKQSFLLKKDEKVSTVVKADVKKAKTAKAIPLSTKQANMADAITEKYNVKRDSAVKIIKEAYNVGDKRGIDPEILIGITAVESGFNPKAKNRSGAIGLTQALPRAHPEKIKRVKKNGGSMYDIHTNLDVGAEIYGELLEKYKGNTTLALQAYNGSVKDKKRKYSKKVMSAISTLKTMSLASNN